MQKLAVLKRCFILKEVILELEQTLDGIENNSKIRSGIIIGAGNKAFVAGADIKEFKNFSKTEAYQLSKSGKMPIRLIGSYQ